MLSAREKVVLFSANGYSSTSLAFKPTSLHDRASQLLPKANWSVELSFWTISCWGFGYIFMAWNIKSLFRDIRIKWLLISDLVWYVSLHLFNHGSVLSRRFLQRTTFLCWPISFSGNISFSWCISHVHALGHKSFSFFSKGMYYVRTIN